MLRVAGSLAAFCALGIASETAAAQTATETVTSIPISISDRQLTFGQALVLSGRAAGEQGQVELQFRPRGAATWQRLGRRTPAKDGRFRFTPKLTRTGAIRVVTVAPVQRDVVGSAPSRSSRERGVTVAGRIGLRRANLAVNRGQRASVTGTLTPAIAGRSVVLEQGNGKSWKQIGTTKTDGKGRFTVGAKVGSTGSAPVRVRFAGDRRNGGAQRTAGRLAVLRPALASRYDLYGGPLACGGSLGYNAMVVAHKSLPCGTKVTIRYRGRTADAVVRDRGPYVGGREFDLAGAVARKLGFNGVGTIYVATR